MNHDHLDALIDAHLSGVLGKEQRCELELRLLHSAADRERFWLLAETHSLLHQVAQQGLGSEQPALRPQRASYWLSWRPLAAAAAGIAFGMLCTSVVFAYVVPKSSLAEAKTLTLADADFESSTRIPALGIPTQSGLWSGDFSRTVAAENGISPMRGQRMLRFLRSDNERSSRTERSYVGEVAQVLDLHSLRSQFSGAEPLLELAALFNAVSSHPRPQYEFTVKAAAYRGSVSDAPRLWEDRDSCVSRSDRFVLADSDLRTWQRVAVPLLVPPDADFIIISCAVVFKGPQALNSVAEFPGHYVDHVEVRLSRSSAADETN